MTETDKDRRIAELERQNADLQKCNTDYLEIARGVIRALRESGHPTESVSAMLDRARQPEGQS